LGDVDGCCDLRLEGDEWDACKQVLKIEDSFNADAASACLALRIAQW